MERLLVVKLDATDCEAEVLLNGIPLARVSAARPRAIVPVHEYTIAGPNRLELVVWPRTVGATDAPAPAPALVSDGIQSAHARILLPRIGNPIDETASRTLGQIDWAPGAGTRFEAPVTVAEDVSLPVNFPRWRWLDAPTAEAATPVRAQVAAWMRSIADDLAGGQTERFLAAARLRTEEIAVAYQRRPEDEFNRLRAHLTQLHAAGGLRWPPTLADDLLLRPVAGGRLLECIDKTGGPALRTEPDDRGQTWAMPLRVAAVAGKIHLLR